jgi:hypothetical protein
MFLGSQHFGGRGGMLDLWNGTRKNDKHLITHTDLHKQTTSWLMHNQNTFGAWMNHRQTQIHKIHHGSDLGEATTFPLVVLSMLNHGANTQMSFCFETPKWESQISWN